MNVAFVGDSYDLVKRFFIEELRHLGYAVVVDPMMTGDWPDAGVGYHRLVGAACRTENSSPVAKSALFLDPDTGVSSKATRHHASFGRIRLEAQSFEMVISFDQSFSRGSGPDAMHAKLTALAELRMHAMYYDSHARFLFASRTKKPIRALEAHLLGLGLPQGRLVLSAASRA